MERQSLWRLNILGGPPLVAGLVRAFNVCLKFEAHCSDKKVCKTCIVGSMLITQTCLTVVLLYWLELIHLLYCLGLCPKSAHGQPGWAGHHSIVDRKTWHWHEWLSASCTWYPANYINQSLPRNFPGISCFMVHMVVCVWNGRFSSSYSACASQWQEGWKKLNNMRSVLLMKKEVAERCNKCPTS